MLLPSPSFTGSPNDAHQRRAERAALRQMAGGAGLRLEQRLAGGDRRRRTRRGDDRLARRLRRRRRLLGEPLLIIGGLHHHDACRSCPSARCRSTRRRSRWNSPTLRRLEPRRGVAPGQDVELHAERRHVEAVDDVLGGHRQLHRLADRHVQLVDLAPALRCAAASTSTACRRRTPRGRCRAVAPIRRTATAPQTKMTMVMPKRDDRPGELEHGRARGSCWPTSAGCGGGSGSRRPISSRGDGHAEEQADGDEEQIESSRPGRPCVDACSGKNGMSWARMHRLTAGTGAPASRRRRRVARWRASPAPWPRRCIATERQRR